MSRDELFDYLCRIQGKQDGYDILFLCNRIDSLLSIVTLSNEIIHSKDNMTSIMFTNKNIILPMPTIKEVETVLSQIKLGLYGKIAIADFTRKFNINNKKLIMNLAWAIDKYKIGYVDYIDFINELRKIYGSNINLNVKLCAIYMFREFIFKWDNIDGWLISKAKSKDIDAYISHDIAYNLFISYFGYDKILFETFYQKYREKKGQYNGMLNLLLLSIFIKENNSEEMPKELLMKRENEEEEKEETEIKIAKPEVVLSPEENIKLILSKFDKTIPMKNSVNLLKMQNIDLNTNCTISRRVYQQFLTSTLKFDIKDIKAIISYFKIENEERLFDLRNYVELIQMYCPRSKCDIISNIIPKLRQEIQMSSIKSFKAFVQKYFNKDSLDITELAPCLESFKLSLYECIVLMRQEDYISINDLFTEFGLKAYFKSTELDISLKSILKKLSEFFESHKDKLKLFKQYDLDKNGYIAPDEFITALNTIKEIEINDKQKMSILKIADKDKNGYINPKEFLLFIKTIKTNDTNQQDENMDVSNMNFQPTQSANLPKVPIAFNKLYRKILSLTAVSRTNLNYNQNIYNKIKDNFLKHMLTLQEDLVYNADNYGSMHDDFLYVDEKREGVVPYTLFSLIIKKRLNYIEKDVGDKMIEFAHLKLAKDVKEKNVSNQTISYDNFLQNLMDYRFDIKDYEMTQKKKAVHKDKEDIREENKKIEDKENTEESNKDKIEKERDQLEQDQKQAQSKDNNENNKLKNES